MLYKFPQSYSAKLVIFLYYSNSGNGKTYKATLKMKLNATQSFPDLQ